LFSKHSFTPVLATDQRGFCFFGLWFEALHLLFYAETFAAPLLALKGRPVNQLDETLAALWALVNRFFIFRLKLIAAHDASILAHLVAPP
jgi:hypothetical protein